MLGFLFLLFPLWYLFCKLSLMSVLLNLANCFLTFQSLCFLSCSSNCGQHKGCSNLNSLGGLRNKTGATKGCTSYQACFVPNPGAWRAVSTTWFKPRATYSGNNSLRIPPVVVCNFIGNQVPFWNFSGTICDLSSQRNLLDQGIVGSSDYDLLLEIYTWVESQFGVLIAQNIRTPMKLWWCWIEFWCSQMRASLTVFC